MVKGIGPELDREIGSSKEGSDRVREGSMRALQGHFGKKLLHQ